MTDIQQTAPNEPIAIGSPDALIAEFSETVAEFEREVEQGASNYERGLGRNYQAIETFRDELRRLFSATAAQLASSEQEAALNDGYAKTHAAEADGLRYELEKCREQITILKSQLVAARRGGGEEETAEELARRFAVYAFDIDGLDSLNEDDLQTCRDFATWVLRDRSERTAMRDDEYKAV